jgi:hypothetical protein
MREHVGLCMHVDNNFRDRVSHGLPDTTAELTAGHPSGQDLALVLVAKWGTLCVFQGSLNLRSDPRLKTVVLLLFIQWTGLFM